MYTPEKYWDRLREMIKEHRWTIQAVMAGQKTPGFAYTVGLSSHSHPELMIIGLPPQVAMTLLNGVAKRALDGTLPTGTRAPIHEVANMPLALLQDDDDYTMGLAAKFSQKWSQEQRGVPCGLMQVVYPDERGIFPWQEGCDPKIIKIQDPRGLIENTSPKPRQSPGF